MARKIELGAGIVAGIVSIAALALLLFAPLVPYCPVPGATPCAHVQYTSLLHTGLDAAGWIYLLCMTALLLAGSAGAIVEGRGELSGAVIPLWGGAALALGGCAFGVRSVGLVYMPAVLALCLAAYASVLRRMRAWRGASGAGGQESAAQRETAGSNRSG